MQDPFDIEIKNIIYSVFPEEDDKYTIFKYGKEYVNIQKDNDSNWLKLDPHTDLPMFDNDPEVNLIGNEILNYSGEENDEEEDKDLL